LTLLFAFAFFLFVCLFVVAVILYRPTWWQQRWGCVTLRHFI
jgi:hypothetical protein